MDERVLRELGDELMRLSRRRAQTYPGSEPVSYTHLTLPTILRV